MGSSYQDRKSGHPLRRCAFPAIALFLICSSPAAAVEAPSSSGGLWHQVTVTDADEWTYRDVTLYWDEAGRSLVIVRHDGAEKRLDPDDLIAVLDRDGQDLTSAVFAGEDAVAAEMRAARAERRDDNLEFAPARPAPAPPFDRRRRSEPAFFHLAADLGGGWSELFGKWFAGLDSGRFAQGGLRAHVNGRQYVHLVYRHQALEAVPMSSYDLDMGEVDWSLQSFQFLVGGHTRPDPAAPLRMVAYAECGVGIMRISGDNGYAGASTSRLALAFQTGLWIHLAENLKLDTGLSFFYKPDWTNDHEAGGSSLGLHLAGMVTM